MTWFFNLNSTKFGKMKRKTSSSQNTSRSERYTTDSRSSYIVRTRSRDAMHSECGTLSVSHLPHIRAHPPASDWLSNKLLRAMDDRLLLAFQIPIGSCVGGVRPAHNMQTENYSSIYYFTHEHCDGRTQTVGFHAQQHTRPEKNRLSQWTVWRIESQHKQRQQSPKYCET